MKVATLSSRYQKLLSARQSKTIGSSGKISLVKIGRGYMPDCSEPALRANASISGGLKKLMKGVPLTRAPFSAASTSGRSSGSASSSGNKNVMASMEPGENIATWRSVAVIAFLVRYEVTPVEATTAGRLASKPAAVSWSHQDQHNVKK